MSAESLGQLYHRGVAALVREIGIVDTLRFLNQFRTGSGDYTEERRHLYEDMSVDDLVAAMKSQRESKSPAPDENGE